MTNNELIQSFLEKMKSKGINKNTYEAYKADLETLSNFAKEKNLLEQDYNFIEEYTSYLRENYSDNSVYRKVASLKLFYKKLFEEGQLKRLLTVDIKHYKNESQIPEILTFEEVEKLCSLCTNDHKGMRDYLLIKLLYETGIKLNEALLLTRNDINNKKIILNNKNKKHILKISTELNDIFNKYYELPICGEALIFDGLSRQNFSARVKKYALEANIKKIITPAKLKNSAIYNFIEQGDSIKELKERLDYTNIGMSGIYKIRNKSEIKKIYEKISIGD